MKKETYFCDVCELEKKVQKKIIQVIFTTEQTEGRSCPPYLCVIENMEICQKCYDKILKGNYLWATGAQGYNVYKFKE